MLPPPEKLTQRAIELDPPPAEARLQLPVRRVPEVPADAAESTDPAAAWVARRPAIWPCVCGATSGSPTRC